MKYNTRHCLISHNKYDKHEMLRFVVINQQLCLDLEYQKQGRGWYIYPSTKNYNMMIKSQILKRKLKIEISEEDYLSIKPYFIH